MTKVRELKPEQAKAAYTLDRHVSVTAGPGAGKTTVLVERYLHILRSRDINVDQIVAITFTNRAANEMRERLRREIDRLLRSAAPEERRTWMRHKRTLDGAVITTIHGFCARLLREFPAEAGIDPQFTLLDQHQSAMLEEARSLGELLKAGWKPKRTIIYASWDAEEPGLIGSTEFAEAHAEELRAHAVVYINSDSNGRGFLGMSGVLDAARSAIDDTGEALAAALA